MRISKNGDIRKQELLDAALKLFYEKGYERTSVNDIIDVVEVTKGAFYYYFKSKEEVLENIAWQQAEKLIEIAKQAANEEYLDAAGKINRLISLAQGYKTANIEQRMKIFKVMNTDDNIKLGRRMFENTVKLSLPIIQEIVEQGNREGVFNVSFPREAAELYIRIINIFNISAAEVLLEKDKNPNAMELVKRKAIFLEETIEKILGARKGTISFVNEFMKCLDR